MRKIFILLLLTAFSKNFGQSDCSSSIVVCGNTQFNGLTVNGSGVQELNLSNACQGIENNSIWMSITVTTAGTLGFLLTPASPDLQEDFDFHVFGPNATCNNLGVAIRCSTTNPVQSGQTDNLTGMNTTETDDFEGPGNLGNSFVKLLTVAAGETYKLMIDRPIGSSNFNLQLLGTASLSVPPTIGTVAAGSPAIVLNQKKCDSDGVLDGFTTFNINSNTTIIGTQTNVAVNYYLTENAVIIGGASSPDEILNINNFTNTSNPQEIFVRITNITTGCFEKTKFLLEVYDDIVYTVTNYSICDDTIDANDNNGRANFNLADVLQKVFNNSIPANIVFEFYLNQTLAATLGAIPLANIFYNTTPNQQTIVLKATTADGCIFYKDIILKVKSLPAKITASLIQCDADFVNDGISLFNLQQANNLFLNNDPNLSLQYFENPAQLTANLPILNAFANTTNPQNIIVKITDSTTQCSSSSSLQLVVNSIPNIPIVPLRKCDDPILENGLATFDLSTANIALTSSQSLKYYLTKNDALLQQNEITANILSYPIPVAYNSSVFVRIQDGNNCSTISELKLIVDKLPDIEKITTAKDFICTNLPTKFVTINAGLQSGNIVDYDYRWFYNGNLLSQTTYSINIYQAGTYTVDVKYKNNICYKTATITVKSSSEAIFENIEIKDLVEDNSVTIVVSGSSTGDYEYSLDNAAGPFQDSNYFENVKIGFHEVYVNDKNKCGTVRKTISVLGAPKYFTPNGDGSNDFWNIKGLNTPEYYSAIVYIFDRYGKLITQVRPKNSGWNGKFNDKDVPSDDYWYTVQLADGRSDSGHFSLKR